MPASKFISPPVPGPGMAAGLFSKYFATWSHGREDHAPPYTTKSLLKKYIKYFATWSHGREDHAPPYTNKSLLKKYIKYFATPVAEEGVVAPYTHKQACLEGYHFFSNAKGGQTSGGAAHGHARLRARYIGIRRVRYKYKGGVCV
jgi:hypothetical protein